MQNGPMGDTCCPMAMYMSGWTQLEPNYLIKASLRQPARVCIFSVEIKSNEKIRMLLLGSFNCYSPKHYPYP
jgi:hypothetical protein